MDKIGEGHISITRKFFSDDWTESRITGNQYKPEWLAPIPSDCILEIDGFFTFTPYQDKYSMQSLELMTNFVTADFSGNLTMGFTRVLNSGSSFSFEFGAALFPTRFSPEAVVKLHFLEKGSGRVFTSFFRCKLGEVYRAADGVYGRDKTCRFSILDPNSATYQTSDQAYFEGSSQIAGIPITRRIQESLLWQGTKQGKEPERDSGVTPSSQSSASQIPQQSSPQVVYVPVPTPQIQFMPYNEPEKKRGIMGKIGCTLVIIIVAVFALIFLCAIFGGSIGN